MLLLVCYLSLLKLHYSIIIIIIPLPNACSWSRIHLLFAFLYGSRLSLVIRQSSWCWWRYWWWQTSPTPRTKRVHITHIHTHTLSSIPRPSTSHLFGFVSLHPDTQVSSSLSPNNTKGLRKPETDWRMEEEIDVWNACLRVASLTWDKVLQLPFTAISKPMMTTVRVRCNNVPSVIKCRVVSLQGLMNNMPFCVQMKSWKCNAIPLSVFKCYSTYQSPKYSFFFPQWMKRSNIISFYCNLRSAVKGRCSTSPHPNNTFVRVQDLRKNFLDTHNTTIFFLFINLRRQLCICEEKAGGDKREKKLQTKKSHRTRKKEPLSTMTEMMLHYHYHSTLKGPRCCQEGLGVLPIPPMLCRI